MWSPEPGTPGEDEGLDLGRPWPTRLTTWSEWVWDVLRKSSVRVTMKLERDEAKQCADPSCRAEGARLGSRQSQACAASTFGEGRRRALHGNIRVCS